VRCSLLLPALLLAACGGESPEDPAEAPAAEDPAEAPAANDPDSDEAELEAAVRGYSRAFLGGEANVAWDLLSARCRDRLSKHEFAGAVTMAPDLYGGAVLEELVIEELSGNLARVTYQYDIAEISQDREPWAFEDARWKNDDC
jgi:hypothetical protein